MTPTLIVLILAAVAYFAGGIVRFLTVGAVLLFMVFLVKHFGLVELSVAGIVIWLLISKGWGQKLMDWLNPQAPTPPPVA